MIPQFPIFKERCGLSPELGKAFLKRIQKRIEVVVLNHKVPLAWIVLIVFADLTIHLDFQSGFARPFFTKDNRRGWQLRIAKYLVPCRMASFQTAVLKYDVGLSVLFRKRIGDDPMMF